MLLLSHAVVPFTFKTTCFYKKSRFASKNLIPFVQADNQVYFGQNLFRKSFEFSKGYYRLGKLV